jgi:hypothetical protein
MSVLSLQGYGSSNLIPRQRIPPSLVGTNWVKTFLRQRKIVRSVVFYGALIISKESVRLLLPRTKYSCSCSTRKPSSGQNAQPRPTISSLCKHFLSSTNRIRISWDEEYSHILTFRRWLGPSFAYRTGSNICRICCTLHSWHNGLSSRNLRSESRRQ